MLSPALYIIDKKRELIANAVSIKEVIEHYENGCGITYNPSDVILKLLTDLGKIFAGGSSG
jgi:hypothetical protein